MAFLASGCHPKATIAQRDPVKKELGKLRDGQLRAAAFAGAAVEPVPAHCAKWRDVRQDHLSQDLNLIAGSIQRIALSERLLEYQQWFRRACRYRAVHA